ncbi:MAG: cell division protein ZapA [Deltaproteobacteria bacterium]|nr:cell division protein ZapA [Deltaproteobacteria bacterium]
MKSLTITVAGQSLQIRSDANEEHLKRLADEVNSRYTAIQKKGPRASQEFRAMALAAITLADDLIAAQERSEIIRAEARKFAESLVARIDEMLARE